MIRNEEGGIELTSSEIDAFALFMAGRVLADDEALDWEEVPELAERVFARLLDVVNELGRELLRRSSVDGIDAAAIFEEVS